MTQWLRGPLSLSEDHDSIPSTYMVVHDHLLLKPQGIRCPLLVPEYTACTWCTDMHAGKTPIHTRYVCLYVY